jgi:hypothetical protein
MWAPPLGLVLLAVAACNGSAVVTITSTPSSDTFLAYRVGLDAVQLQSSSGSRTIKVLPSGTTVDFVNLLNLSEVLGVPTGDKGSYTSAVITLDYGQAQIVYDDGSLNGVALSPVNAGGQAMGQVSIKVNFDPSSPLLIAAKQTGQVALNFNLAASNLVNLSANTVTVTPLFVASALPIDSKTVRIRGPLGATNATNLAMSTGVMPFDGPVGSTGQLGMATSEVTTYEVNGTPLTGAAGLAQLASLSSGSLVVAYGTLTSTTSTTDSTVADDTDSSTIGASTATEVTTPIETSTTTSSVSFAVSQVLAGSSVQGSGSDRISGVVAARSGNSLAIEDGTLIGNDGTTTFIPGTSLITVGASTAITEFGQGAADANTLQQISVGSQIDAFGVATSTSSGSATLDATAGRVRLDASSAAGLVTAQGVGALTLDLTALGGRAISAFDFVGSGADPTQYSVTTGALDLTNSIAGAPVFVTGLPNSFGVAPPNFTAGTLLDSTTIQAELVVDWGAGTAAPFTTFDTSEIDLDVLNSNFGQRHQIQIGSQIINIVGLSQDPLISPSTGSAAVFGIGHSVSSTVETFDTYTDFITQLQTELNGTALATGMTAVGQYTADTFAFSATSITIFLNN